MLIDWLTARCSWESMTPEIRDSLTKVGDRVMRYCPVTSEVRWESSAWDSVRSDSHQIACRVGSDAFWLQGSPARVCGSGDAVFGEGASSSLDLPGCLVTMVDFLSAQLLQPLPRDPSLWIVSRIDITQNLLLDDLPAVRVALRYLRECEGGRYRVSQQAGDTVYWSHRSRLRSGKAYAKGPHLEYMMKKPDYTGREYSAIELQQASRLLRMEMKLGAQYFRERLSLKWYDLSPDDLRAEWSGYFGRMIGEATMKTDGDVKGRVLEAARRIVQAKNPERSGEGQGKAAYAMWLLIQAEGWQAARETTPKTSWYRNIKILHAAGLGDMDISAGKVIPFRQKIIECQQVNTWDDLRKAA